MTDSAEIVQFLPGFKCVDFGDRGTIPNDYILAKLLRPNSDPEKVILEVSPVLDSKEETQSQLILREHNNWIVSHLGEESKPENNEMLRSLCEKMEQTFKGLEVAGRKGFPINFDMLRYHIAQLNYLDYFLLPPKKYDEIPRQLTEFGKDLRRGLKTGKWESKVVEEYLKRSEGLKQKIRKDFPDYEVSESIHQVFIEAAIKFFPDEWNKLYAEKLAGFELIRDMGRENYRQPPEKRMVKYPLPWQCEFCHKWYEREQKGNGKKRIKCDACFRAWDRNRRRKGNS